MNVLQIHTGEKPNVCPYCNHGFIQTGTCKQHIFKVHGIEVPKGMGMKQFIASIATNAGFAANLANAKPSASRGRKPRSPPPALSTNRPHEISFAPHTDPRV